MGTMKNTFWLWLALVTVFTCTSHALAKTPENLAGTWMIDTKATEESLIHTRPFKDATSFIHGIHFYGNLTFEFDGDKLLLGAVPNNLRKDEYLLVSGQALEKKYVKKANNGASEVAIGVSILNDKNISIAFLSAHEMKYLLWKRVKLDPNKTTPNDFKPEFDAFLEMLKNIDKAFGSPLWPTVKTDVKP